MREEEPRPVAPDESLLRGGVDDRGPREERVEMREMHVAETPERIHADDDERARSGLAEGHSERA
jgi:hypothetical protein